MSLNFSILKETIFSLLFFICLQTIVFAQDNYSYRKVEGSQLSGRLSAMQNVNNFGRLPAQLKGSVREAVWNLGEYSAGLYIDFKTNSDTIVVKYKVKSVLNMPHMPTTGVSGVDLYFHNEQNKRWEWAFGRYQFKDTIQYTFSNIGHNTNGTYRLYLPLYNIVDFLEIGTPKSNTLDIVTDNVKPIVIYGTSIAQGACTSRPGLGWTSILGRDFPNEVINLGFSGNGRLEQPILDVIAAQEAAVYILDCIPNLSITKERSAEQLDSLILHAVEFLRSKRPHTPIVLTEHSSAFTEGFLNKATMEEYGTSTKVGQEAFKKLKKLGVKNIYWLNRDDIGLDVNSTVDYAHPNDIGMMKLAKAYEKLLKKILK